MIMKTERKNRWSKLVYIFMISIITFLVSACNDTMDDLLRYDYPASGINYDTGHVLLIVVDGASGRAIQAARNARKTPTLQEMMAHAVYTDYGLSDDTEKVKENMTNARGWANLMIGTTKHGIQTDADLRSYGGTTLVEHLEASTVSMYANDEFRDAFAPDGMNAPVLNSDEAVKDRLVEELSNTLNIPSELIIAEFEGVNKAGQEFVFYDEDKNVSQEVQEAVGNIDLYLSEIMSALKARPYFKQENWLVIVTSNYGGLAGKEETDQFYDLPGRNTFTLMYNERLVSDVQGRPANTGLSYSFYTPMWGYDKDNTNPTRYLESAKMKNFEMGGLESVFDGGEVTIQFFMKSNMATSQKYIVLSKSSDIEKDGWALYFNDSNKRMCFTVGKTRGAVQYGDYKNIDWTQWHTVSITIKQDPSKKDYALLSLYLDGEENRDGGKNNNPKISDLKSWYTGGKEDVKSASFRIGGTENRASQNKQRNTAGQTFKNFLYITNVQIYNTAIPAADLKKYSGKNMLHEFASYPYWDNLIGYWPCDLENEEAATETIEDKEYFVLKDHSQYRKEDGTSDFIVDRGASSSGVWVSGISQDEAIHPIPASDPLYYRKTFNTVDVSRHIFMWLGKEINWDWSLEGRVWSFKYNNMTIDK